MYKYQLNFMPEAYTDYCSTACFMWILNYFRYTQFNMKDTRDVMKIAKLWPFKRWDLLDEYDIAFSLNKLWFYIDIFHEISEEEYSDIFIDPVKAFKRDTKEEFHKFIEWNHYLFSNWWHMPIDDKKLKKLKEEQSMTNHFNANFIQIIKENQNNDTLFLLGLDWYVLLNFPYPQEDFCWGHIVLCKWYKDWIFEIYDSWPEKNPLWITEERLYSAMTKSRKYHFLMIRPNDSRYE